MFSDTFENVFPSLYYNNPRQIYNGMDRGKEDIYQIKLDISAFKPVELSVKVEGNKLVVSGKHQNKTKNGFENCDFSREYEIPGDVDLSSISSRITQNGILIIEGDIKKDDPKSCSANDAVDMSDPTKFHVYVNMCGYKNDDINVKLSGNDLIVEAKQVTDYKSEDGKRKLKKTKSFVASFTLPPDVDVNNMIPKFTTPNRLDIEAPRVTKRPDNSEKNLEIKNSNPPLK